MGPRKHDNKDVNNSTRRIQQRTCKTKINSKNLPLIRIEIPSKTDTENSRSRVVTAQPLMSQKQWTKKNTNSNVRSTKPMLRSRAAIKVQANADNMDTKLEPTKESTEAEANPKKPTPTNATPAKLAVKRKSTPKCQLNKKITGTNKSQAIDTTANDSDGSVLEEPSLPKVRKTKVKKETSVTRDTKAANDADKRLRFTQRRITRNNSLTSKRGTASIAKRIVDDQKGKNIKEPTTSKSLLTSLHSVSKDQLINVKMTFDGAKPTEECRLTPVSSECMSWTRDISTSSTTTCFTVRTDDFVRFDEKLPIVKLTEFNQTLNLESVTNDKSNDEITKNLSNYDINASRAATRSPSLTSTSDSDSDMNIVSETSNDNDKNLEPFQKILNTLSTSLKNFDIEIMNWIGYDGKDYSPVTEKVSEKFYSVFKEEGEVITNCRNIKRILLDDDDLTMGYKTHNNTNIEDAKVSNVDSTKPDNDVKNDQTASKCSVSIVKDAENRDEDTAKINHASVAVDDVCNDDDDALSLFAESITGFESSRKNNSVKSTSSINILDHGEYVPQSLNENSTNANETATYHPTKINNNVSNGLRGQCKSGNTVFEKQNADSTSTIHKEFRVNDNDVSRNNSEVPINSQPYLNSTNTKAPQRPLLLSSLYKAVHWTKSTVFAGVCFFNLAYKCSKFNCNFKHTLLDAEIVKTRLKNLNENSFIQEYKLMRVSSALRKYYQMDFLVECIRRNITPLLFEMVIDNIIKNTCKELKVEVVETVLLYLGTVDLTAHTDYLLFAINTDTALCDSFMHMIAETQNFTRFKKIFIDLTNFFCEIQRDIKYDVATSLLVRLTILPYEEPLARALLNIIKRTSPDIFNNSMILHLENQLLSENEALYDELKMLKDANKIPATSNLTMHVDDGNFDNIDMDIHTETNARCSPDTTRLDFLNKPFGTPIIKRNIIPRMGLNTSTPMVFSMYNQSFEGRSSSSIEGYPSTSAAAGLMKESARPRFQERSSFTPIMNNRLANRNRTTIGPGKKFNRI